jgi:adenosylcobyric acid synthase
MSGGLMVCGTNSDSGKTTLVTGLCRLLARRGVRVAPFKAQNMALNSAVTAEGHEIGRAQAAQAQAAGVAPEVAMNPILLKPTSSRSSQVVVMGRPWAVLDAAGYQKAKADLWPIVIGQLERLQGRYDVVLCEGAGSPAEINLLEHDVVNLRVAEAAGFPAILVGDIDRGGVFAAMFGTVALLPDEYRKLIRGFVINKFRGDPALLREAPAELERRTGIPTLGVIPWLDGVGIDAEDSLALRTGWPHAAGLAGPAGTAANAAADVATAVALDVAVVRFPHISNFTDLDALAVEPAVRLRMVETPESLGRPDLVILPGSKSTVADLHWLRVTGLADALTTLSHRRPGQSTILGICGGYQMLGEEIDDAVEAKEAGTVAGLGLLSGKTVFHPEKITRAAAGTALGCPVRGYEIHHGWTEPSNPWLELDSGFEGSEAAGGAVLGTSVHGLFEADGFRRQFLRAVAARAGRPWAAANTSFAEARAARFDRLADAMEEHLDMAAVEALIEQSRRRPRLVRS